MVTIKLSSVKAHPREIFKALVDREAKINWALKEEKIELPRYVKPIKVEYNAGVWNFVKGILKELQP